MPMIEISDRTRSELIEIGRLIVENTGYEPWTPEDVIPYMIGFMAGYDPRIHKIVYPEGV